MENRLRQFCIQNITGILEDLLKDYDKTERPSYKDGKIIPILYHLLFCLGKTTQVKVNILIRSMGPINEKKMVNIKIKL